MTTTSPAPTAAPRAAARTYEVRTFGCQMNVHDSERLSGLLEAAGYVRAGGGETPDVVVFNTCAVRENADNKLYGNLGHLAPVKAKRPGHADRRRRLPGAEGPRTSSSARRPGSTSSSAPTTSASLPALLERARHNEEAQVEILESLEVFPSTLPDPARVRLRRVGLDQRRLQQHLHVLHRPEPARQGEGPPARRDPRRGRGAGRRGRDRGDPARAERQHLRRRVRRPRRVRQAAPGLRRASRVSSASASPARTRRRSPTT